MRRTHQGFQRAEDRLRRIHLVGRDGLWLRRAHERPLVHRGGIREFGNGHVGFNLRLVTHDEPSGIRRLADDSEVEAPFRDDALGELFRARLQDHQHALLALGEHHLVGRHAGLALGHVVEIEVDADAALVGHFDR